MKDENPGAAGTALTTENASDDNQSFESSDKPENHGEDLSHVGSEWVCCPYCARWLAPESDGRTCSKCGRDTFGGRSE